MKVMIKNFKWLLLVSLTFVACNSSDDAVADPNSNDGSPLTAGTADFSKYVALGDSFAAGYSDGALFKAGQQNAYPNIMATQFALVGGGDFTTPWMSDDNIGGFSMGGVQVPGFGTRLYFNAANSTPVPVTGISGTDITAHLTGPFNNMGIPGAKAIHLGYSGYAAANPYFGRFASSATATVLEDALAQDPTFFSLWIGGNDVLGYATSGGDGTNPITPPATFQAVYSDMAAQLSAGGRKGVVANLPYVSTLPYFTTVPYNPVPLDAATISLLMNTTNGYGLYNGALQLALSNGFISADEAARRTIAFHPGADNAVVIVDSYLTDLTPYGIPSYRQATAEDLVVLPARAFIGTLVGGNPYQVNGVSVPLADKWVLSKEEITEVRDATDAYNAAIFEASETNDLAFVDAKAVMDQLKNGGIVGNGYTMTATYVTGNTFSLDGIHPSPKGYALIANKFLEAINEKYGSNFKGVNLGKYRILYPQDPNNF
ncbi:G-D-S-L family lipolytic protein [Flavobacterium sp. XGLA_31]|uniref:G-D-S-L family lipolytic protein n=1 Tax=Flavobacterium sp. XGLA_31 TaxID=3447666 RepID=UPI003F3F1C75